jgi:hypothetical protein
MATAMSRIPITKAMIDDTLREVLNNQMSDRKIAEKCLVDPSHTKVVSDIRRSHGFRKDRRTGKLIESKPRGSRTWENSSMPRPAR